jgi:hypothetical protein
MADDLQNIGINDPAPPDPNISPSQLPPGQALAPGQHGVVYIPPGWDDKPSPPPQDHSDYPDAPFKDGTKHTYYGYKGDADWDSASGAGKGDGGWQARGSIPLVPRYDVALTKSKRIKLFGGNGETSTGKEFTEDGHKYRDSDTAPEADDIIDEYAPDHPADPAGTPRYYGGVSTGHEGEGGNLTAKKPPIQQWKEDNPALSKYSDDQIISAVKPKVAPNMSDDDFRQAANSPDGAQTIKQAFDKLPILQQTRIEHPEFASWDDDKLTRAMYGSMQKQGITNGMTLEQFQAKMNPPNPVLNSISSFLQSVTAGADPKDPWTGVLSDYQKMFSEAAGVVHDSAAGAYGAIDGAKQFMSNLSPLKLADQIAKRAGINMDTQGAYDKFTQNYLRTPFDGYFRRGLDFLNQKSEQQRQAAAANFQKAKDLNPLLKVSADIAGSLPEMAATFGAGFEVKLATKSEIMGRALWATTYQTSAQNGKAVEATAQKQFLQQSRSGFTTALQTLMFNSPYLRWQTGLLNAMLGATDQDLHAWIQGRLNPIDEKVEPAVVNFALGYFGGHDSVDEASKSDIDASRKALDEGNPKLAKQLIDRSFALMPEDEQQQHARNFITLTDILADNSLRGDALKTRPIDEPGLDKPVDLKDFQLRQQTRLKEVHFDPDESLNQPSGLRAEVLDPDVDLKNAPAYAPLNADTPEKMAAEAARDKPPKPPDPEPPKTPPLTKQDVQRFTRSYFYNKRSQAGSIINPGQLLLESGEKAKDATKDIVKAFHSVLDIGVLGPKAKEAEAEIGGYNARNSFAGAAMVNQAFREYANVDMVQDLDTHAKRQHHLDKYSQAQQKEIFMKFESGEPTGDPIIDEMIKVSKEITDDFARTENDAGVTFDVRENYIMRNWKADKDTKEAWVQNHAKKFGDPSFLKPRQLESAAQGFSIGKELVSNSIEDALQARTMQHIQTMSKVHLLEDWKEQGTAFVTTDPNAPEEAKLWPEIRSPKRSESGTGTMYYVHPEKAAAVKRAWDPMFNNDTANKSVGRVIGFLKAVKSVTVPIRLLSLAHAMHVPQIRFASRGSYLLRGGTAETGAGAWWGLLADAPAQGLLTVAKDIKDRGNIVGALQGQVDLRSLSPDDRWAIEQLLDGGFNAGFSEHQKNFISQGIRKMLDGKHLAAWNSFTDLGHKILSKADFQHYVFSTMIPSVKVAHILERFSDLYREDPGILDDSRKTERIQSLRKIVQQADRKFGEMFYDNMFAVKWVKNLGIGTFLSVAWQLGLVDYGGGLVDVAANPAKLALMDKQAKAKAGGAGRVLLSDRLLMSYIYTGIVMATNAMYTYINMRTKKDGDKHQFGWKDMFFPWNGFKPNGEDKRLRGVTFPTEMANITEHIAQEGLVKGVSGTIVNKYTGVLATSLQALYNTNYLGNKITDADGATLQSIMDRAGYFLRESWTPMGSEQYAKVLTAPPEMKLDAGRDAVAAFFGLNEAPAWTGRTPIANTILEAKRKEKGGTTGQSVAQQKEWEEKDKIRDLLNNGANHEQVAAAIKEALKMGISHKSLENLTRTKKVTTDKLAFKALDSVPSGVTVHGTTQLELLKKMTPEERKIYLPFAHQKTIQALHENRSNN